jgi:hypothetical protein
MSQAIWIHLVSQPNLSGLSRAQAVLACDVGSLYATDAALARAVAVEQRRLIASTTANTLMAANWTVTVVGGGAPDRYTGIEATRGTEHLLAAACYGELIVDQAGVDDRGAGDDLVEGLRQVGATVAAGTVAAGTVAAGTVAAGAGDRAIRTLYGLSGGPSLAHAIQAGLRRSQETAVPRPCGGQTAVKPQGSTTCS